jgi:hypothetical protein
MSSWILLTALSTGSVAAGPDCCPPPPCCPTVVQFCICPRRFLPWFASVCARRQPRVRRSFARVRLPASNPSSDFQNVFTFSVRREVSER